MSKQEILELIDELTDRLEGPAEQLLTLAVRSTLSAAIIQLVFCAAVLVFAAWFVPLAVRKQQAAGQWNADGWLFGCAFVVVVGAVAFVFFVLGLHMLLNVEFYAIKSLVPGL